MKQLVSLLTVGLLLVGATLFAQEAAKPTHCYSRRHPRGAEEGRPGGGVDFCCG